MFEQEQIVVHLSEETLQNFVLCAKIAKSTFIGLESYGQYVLFGNGVAYEDTRTYALSAIKQVRTESKKIDGSISFEPVETNDILSEEDRKYIRTDVLGFAMLSKDLITAARSKGDGITLFYNQISNACIPYSFSRGDKSFPLFSSEFLSKIGFELYAQMCESNLILEQYEISADERWNSISEMKVSDGGILIPVNGIPIFVFPTLIGANKGEKVFANCFKQADAIFTAFEVLKHKHHCKVMIMYRMLNVATRV